jgi:uncharacterized Zn-binding protein involved in type VI secretion
MPGPFYHAGAAAMCPHGGQVLTTPSSPRVLVSGMPVATLPDASTVVGCVFNVAGAPHPCVRVQWTVGAVRVLIDGKPALLQSSMGLALAPDQAPQGPPIITTTQMRVIAT